MNCKQKLQAFVARLDDRLSLDEIFEKLDLFRAVVTALQQADQGLGIDHDEFMKELEMEHEAQEAALAAKSKGRSASNQSTHRARRAKNGKRLHQTTQNSRGKA